MISKKLKEVVLLLWLVLCCCLISSDVFASEPDVHTSKQAGATQTSKSTRLSRALALANRSVLSKPLIEGKHIVAHHMTEVFCEGSPSLAFLKREHFDPEGSTHTLGGYLQFLPYIDYREGSPAGVKSMDEVCEIDIRAAMTCGLTGFQFYYPFGDEGLMSTYAKRIRAYAQAVERLDVDFKLSLCFSNADHDLSEVEKIERWAEPTRRLLEETPDSVWLKTPDGRHIFYTWLADGLADEIDHAYGLHQKAEQVKYAALAYEHLAQALGVECAFVQLILNYKEDSDPHYLDELLRYFPAVWGWAQLDYHHTKDNPWDALASKTRQRNRTYTQTASLDFYSSKTFPKGSWQLIFDIDKAIALGVKGQYRHAMELELSKAFRLSLERGIREDNGIINVVTWNDFAEGHHLSPDINHNFGFAVLLNHYRDRWMNPEQLAVPKESLVLFYKKYPSTVVPRYNMEVHYEGSVPPSASDVIEAVAILKEPADIFIKGKHVARLQAGLQVVRVPIELGPVWAELQRDGKTVLRLDSPQEISGKPLRTDRTTYAISTERDRYLQTIFGDDRRSLMTPSEVNRAMKVK